MTNSNSLLLYVADVPNSVQFYSNLLGRAPVEASPTFALFILPSGLAMGLWGKAGVMPAPTAAGGGSELGLKIDDVTEVDRIHADWQSKGATIALQPTDLDFGRSFVALDPDGHRLRVYAVVEE